VTVPLLGWSSAAEHASALTRPREKREADGERVLHLWRGPATLSFLSLFSRQSPVAKRQFTDDDGTAWVVWDVHPEDLGRTTYDRRASALSADGAPRADGASRRSERAVHPELQKGWLCFQAGTEKRRFTPIPADWAEMSDGALRVMLAAATPAPPADGRSVRPSAGT
jgi:hypothetical protein